MPNIHSVLENFEKTISANEEAGVTSKMFLSNIAKKQNRNLATKPAAAGLQHKSSHHHRRPAPKPLPKVPEKHIPCDVTVSTATTTASDVTYSNHDAWQGNDDPFADDDPFAEDDGCHNFFNGDGDDDRPFSATFDGEEPSAHSSFSSFSSHNDCFKPRAAASSSSTRRKPQLGALSTKEVSQRKLRSLCNNNDNDKDDGFSGTFPDDDDMSIFSSSHSKLSMSPNNRKSPLTTSKRPADPGITTKSRRAPTRSSGSAPRPRRPVSAPADDSSPKQRERRSRPTDGSGRPSSSSSSRKPGASSGDRSRKLPQEKGSSSKKPIGSSSHHSSRSRNPPQEGGSSSSHRKPGSSSSERPARSKSDKTGDRPRRPRKPEGDNKG